MRPAALPPNDSKTCNIDAEVSPNALRVHAPNIRAHASNMRRHSACTLQTSVCTLQTHVRTLQTRVDTQLSSERCMKTPPPVGMMSL